MKQSFDEKRARIIEGIKRALKNEGVELTSILQVEINNIAIGYMLVEQCLWFRVESDEKVDILLAKYQDITTRALSLLTKFHFEDLVYTFRKTYTNLFEVQGSGRKYNLSKKDYVEFVGNIENGSLVVLTKPQKVRKTSSTKVEVAKNNFMANLLANAPKQEITISKKSNEIPATPQPKVETNKVEIILKQDKKSAKTTTQPKVENKFLANLAATPQPMVEETKVGAWVEHPFHDYLAPKTFIKVKLVDTTAKTIFGRFIDVTSNDNKVIVKIDSRGIIHEVNVNEIAKVFTYVK